MANFWKKVFGKKKNKGYVEEDTIPLPVPSMVPGGDDVTKPLTPLSSVFSHLEKNSNPLGLEPSQLL
ncbi:MAG: hypothetical protein MUO62_02865, partial [Anaerolineales bacterium]|nr:hypothetical protein [Anaerolineales bacterium]